MEKVNLTPVFEHVMGISGISKREKIQLVIDALRKNGDKPFSTKATISEIAKKIESKK